MSMLSARVFRRKPDGEAESGIGFDAHGAGGVFRHHPQGEQAADFPEIRGGHDKLAERRAILLSFIVFTPLRNARTEKSGYSALARRVAAISPASCIKSLSEARKKAISSSTPSALFAAR